MARDDADSSDPRTEYAFALVAIHARSGEPFLLRVEGASMGACLAGSCECLVDPHPGTLRVGDVALVRLNGEFVAHRVVAWMHDGAVVTKGDRCFHSDGTSPPESIVGRVTGVMRDGRLATPIHWRRPISRLVALLSRVEAALWPRFSYPLRVIHRAWRLGVLPSARPVPDDNRRA